MKRCITCNKVIKQGHGIKADKTYCGWECYKKLTPKMAELESIYEKPLKQIILDTLNSNKNVGVTAELLGTNKQQLYNWMRKCNIEKVLFWE